MSNQTQIQSDNRTRRFTTTRKRRKLKCHTMKFSNGFDVKLCENGNSPASAVRAYIPYLSVFG